MVFIYDMAGSNYTNFELDLSKKILNLLKVGTSSFQMGSIDADVKIRSRMEPTAMCHTDQTLLHLNHYYEKVW